jgi:ABC-type glycerol-3-phosphate transport system substrate-binding protein
VEEKVMMDKVSLNRREFLRVAGLTSAGLLAAACVAMPPPAAETTTGDTGAAQAPAGDRPTVEWWPGWPDPVMEEIGKIFQESHPEITLKTVSIYPDMAGTLAAIAGGTPPDIISDVPYLELIVRDVILPLDDMIAASTIVAIDDGDIRQDHWEVFAWEGQHYGVPAVDTGGRQGMGYNLNVLEAAGLDPQALPTTWEEVFAWHQQITTYDQAGNLDVLGMNPMAERTDATSYGDPWMWPEMWGFHYFNEETKQFEIDREETVAFLNVIKQFFDDVGAEKMEGMTKANEGIPRGPFGNGKAAMRITYPSGPAGVWQANPEQHYKFTWVPMPSNRSDVTMQTLSGHAYIILKDAKQPQAAFQLAEFMTEKQACDLLFDAIGWLGPRKSWQAQVDMGKYPPEVQENIKFFYTSLDEADELWFEKDPVEGITSTEWNSAWQGVVYGQFTPEEAAANMQAKLTEELAAVVGG